MARKRNRTPGMIPAGFVYRSFDQELRNRLRRAGLDVDIHATYTYEAMPYVNEADTAWGLYPLGYTSAHAGFSGTNWYLDDASAFINIYPAGRSKGRMSIIMDDEDDPDQSVYFRLLTGQHVTTRMVNSDLPGVATWSREYTTKAEFIDCLAQADVLIRDNAYQEVMFALYRNQAMEPPQQ